MVLVVEHESSRGGRWLRAAAPAGPLVAVALDLQDLVGPVDAHHRQARFGWALGPSGAESLIDGFDVLERDDDGRVTLVLGFLDKVPSA